MRPKTAATAALILFAGLEAGRAYTWYLAGTQEYFYTVKSKSAAEFENLSNSQKVVEKRGDLTLMENATLYVAHKASVPYPLAPDAVKEADPKLLASYYKDPAKQKTMKDLAAQIIGKASTLEEAVTAIAQWVRNNVTYALGSPVDPIGVIRARSAFCVGYARLVVELLRAAGIPARELTCWIPPNCGWGFGDEGGGHEFLEYYYPGEGWYCLDPQASLQFADPYHVRGNVSFVEEVREVDFSYAADYDEQPVGWPTYSAVYREEAGNRHPAYVFKITSPGGGFGSFFMSKELVLKDRDRFSGFRKKDGSFGSSWVGSGRGFDVEMDWREITVRTSLYSPYFTVFPGDLVSKDVIERDEWLILRYSSCLLAAQYRFKGNAKYLFEADFTDERAVKKLMLRGENGSVPGGNVKVRIGDAEVEAYPDEGGFVYIVMPQNKAQVIVGGKEYEADFSKGPVVRLPTPGTGGADIEKARAAFEEAKGIGREGGPALLVTMRDYDLCLSASVFNSAYLYGGGLRLTELPKAEGEGFLYYRNADLKPDTDYTLLLRSGNRYTKRILRFKADGILRIEAGVQGPFPDSLSSPSGRFYGLSSYYELADRDTVIPYPARDGKILLDFPEGSYYFSDTQDAKYVREFKFTGKPDAFEFSYGTVGLDDYVALRKKVYGDASFVAGHAALADGNPYVREVSWLNASTFAAGTVTADRDGNFLLKTPDPDTDYLFYFPHGDSGLVLSTLRTAAGSAQKLDLSAAALDKKTVRLKRGDKKTFASGFSLLFPRYKDKRHTAVPRKFAVDRRKPVELFVDGGRYYLSLTDSLQDAICVDGGVNAVSEYWFTPDPADPAAFAAKQAMYASVFGPEGTGLLLRLTDEKGAPMASKPVSLAAEGQPVTKYLLDANGILFAEGLTPGTPYVLKYGEAGISLAHPVTLAGPGLTSVECSLKTSPKISFAFRNYDGFCYRAYPGIDKYGGIAFAHEACPAGKDNRLSLYTDDPVVYLRLGRDRILKGFGRQAAAYTVDFKALKPDALKDYATILSAAYAGRTGILLGLKSAGVPLTGYSARIGWGSSFREFASNADGLILITDPRLGRIKLYYADRGHYVDREWDITPQALNVFEFDMEQEAGLKVSLSGKKDLIRGKAVTVYKEAKLEPDGRVSFREKTVCYADANGVCFITLPPQTCVIEVEPKGSREVKLAEGRQQALTVKVK